VTTNTTPPPIVQFPRPRHFGTKRCRGFCESNSSEIFLTIREDQHSFCIDHCGLTGLGLPSKTRENLPKCSFFLSPVFNLSPPTISPRRRRHRPRRQSRILPPLASGGPCAALGERTRSITGESSHHPIKTDLENLLAQNCKQRAATPTPTHRHTADASGATAPNAFAPTAPRPVLPRLVLPGEVGNDANHPLPPPTTSLRRRHSIPRRPYQVSPSSILLIDYMINKINKIKFSYIRRV
jgi:hypothetical protein